MPLGMSPNETHDVYLKSDADKPEETRPTFQFRYLTCRQVRQVQAMREQVTKERDNAKCDALVTDVLMVGLVGWRNVSMPTDADRTENVEFHKDKVDDILTFNEKWELVNAYPGQQMDTETKKAFGSPSRSPTSGSAAPAAAATASVSPTSETPATSPKTPAPPAAAGPPSAPPAPPAAGGERTS